MRIKRFVSETLRSIAVVFVVAVVVMVPLWILAAVVFTVRCAWRSAG